MTSQTPEPMTAQMLDGPVTVTLTASGTQRVFHGHLTSHYTAVTLGSHRGTFTHLRDRAGSTTRPWAQIAPSVSIPFMPTGGFPYEAKDWRFGIFGLDACLDSENVKVQPLTDEGRAWLRQNETPGDKRSRLLARFAEFDTEAAADLDALISELMVDVREDGYLESRAYRR